MSWYYAENGKQLGPVSEADFNASVSAGKITGETLVWQEGLPQWISYGELQRSGGAAVLVASLSSCVECERRFPEDAMANFGGNFVCADCKPVYVQKVKEGARVGGELSYAGVGRRFWAKILDSVVQQVISYGLGVVLVMALANADTAMLINSLLGMVIHFGIAIFFLGKFGATPGKLMLKTRVVRSDGSRLSYGRATGRVFAEMLSGLILCIGYLMAFWDSEKRTLHDRIVDTRVIYPSR